MKSIRLVVVIFLFVAFAALLPAAQPDGSRLGQVRVVDHSLTDDNGLFLGLGVSYFTALFIAAIVLVFVLFTAWMNGAFLRCPHCRKIGAWRFDAAELPTYTKDADGVVESSRQIRVCRRCGGRVLDTWSDHGGRAIEKIGA